MIEKLKNIISGLTEQVGLVDFYLEEVKNLPHKETTFSVCDLDYTLFSRDEQMEGEPILTEKR